MMAKEVTQEHLDEFFPPPEILHKWHKGEEADWPPREPMPMPGDRLRFDVGARVLCRTGPDAEKDWSPGTIIKLWYREGGWPEGAYAPIKFSLTISG